MLLLPYLVFIPNCIIVILKLRENVKVNVNVNANTKVNAKSATN